MINAKQARELTESAHAEAHRQRRNMIETRFEKEVNGAASRGDSSFKFFVELDQLDEQWFVALVNSAGFECVSLHKGFLVKW